MPPLRPCLERGCAELTTASRCPEHEREHTNARLPGTTAAWRRARTAALRRAGHRCERCGRTDELHVTIETIVAGTPQRTTWTPAKCSAGTATARSTARIETTYLTDEDD
ncbi:MAG: hypothetical protein M3459_07775 [Actinomycetota bacterium]|nr:hypothetical protein [Actinomycetota bacterium]